MDLQKAFWELVYRIIAELFGPRLLDWLLRQRRLPSPIHRYLRLQEYLTQLPLRLSEMPFIYNGLKSDVLNDFVEIKIDHVHTSSLARKQPIHGQPYEFLRTRPCVAIIGNAG